MKATEVEPGLYYDCPTLETGHYSLSEGEYTVRLRRGPPRAELRFKCVACEEEHTMVLGETAVR